MKAVSDAERSATILSTKSGFCLVIRAIPQSENSTGPCFWTAGTVPAEWMEVLAAWDAVEPGVEHNSCDTLKEWTNNNCLIMFLDGTGGPFSSDPVLRRCGWRGCA